MPSTVVRSSDAWRRLAAPAAAAALAILIVGCSTAPAASGLPTGSGAPTPTAPALRTASAAPSVESVALRLQVSLTPEELASFGPALQRLDDAHPEFTVSLENVPQEAESERITSELASGDVPDVLRVQGSNVQQWIRRTAFVDLTDKLAPAGVDLSDFYQGPVDQFRWHDRLWGIPDSASPEIVFYDRKAFADAGIEPPGKDWTYDDMRTAALKLTADKAGRHPGEAGFDPKSIERWGWNGGVTYYWQDALIEGRGGELCPTADCTTMSFTGPANETAFDWWVGLVKDDHAALYDPYGGSQTGVPGDPFISGKAVMGSNGTFAIGQLNAGGTIDYDIVPPLIGVDGKRHTPLSTNGYVVSAASKHPDAAWALLQALVTPEFLANTWGKPGHAVPARRSVAASVIDPSHAPANQAAILDAMEVGTVFRPYTAGAREAYDRTIGLFTKMNTGELAIPDALEQIEAAANAALAADREP
jgi:multiple sugar transport system substrate-binding protein